MLYRLVCGATWVSLSLFASSCPNRGEELPRNFFEAEAFAAEPAPEPATDPRDYTEVFDLTFADAGSTDLSRENEQSLEGFLRLGARDVRAVKVVAWIKDESERGLAEARLRAMSEWLGVRGLRAEIFLFNTRGQNEPALSLLLVMDPEARRVD